MFDFKQFHSALFNKKYLWFFLLFSIPAHAKLFSNSYISFELPPNWECQPDRTEYICTSQYSKQTKEAIIIFAAKESGPSDNLPTYLAYLKNPRPLADKSGKMIPSKVLHTTERKIHHHPWADGMHLGSEIASYYTRYLATVKDRVAILVTFSAHKDHYTKYSQDFLKAIESLRVTATKNMLEQRPTLPQAGRTESIGTPIGEPIDPYVNQELPPEPTGSDMKTKLMALALLIGAVGFYLWRRKKR